jgi:hypothetical protein
MQIGCARVSKQHDQDTGAQLRYLRQESLRREIHEGLQVIKQQVLAEPEWQGRLIEPDLRALTPLKWQHINPYSTFTLDMHERLPLNS